MVDSRKLATATVFGVIIALVKAPFPFPITDLLNIVEVPMLGLSFLLLGKGGATYSGLVNGMISSVAKIGFFPLNLIFGVCYGLLVDAFGVALRVRGAETTSSRRMMVVLGGASTVLGVGITYFTLAFNVNPSVSFPGYSVDQLIEVVYLPTVAWGILSGGVGGFVTARVWERGLRTRFAGTRAPPKEG